MAANSTPISLACLPPLATTPSYSGQKRSRANPADGEGDIKDTGAPDSGGRHIWNAVATAEPALLPSQGPTGQGEGEISPELARADAVTAFMASSLLPEPNHLKVDHISALMSLALDGHVHKAAVKLLAPAYPHQEAESIWTAWAPHLFPPPDHPLAEGTL
jgi:hypothetical protein